MVLSEAHHRLKARLAAALQAHGWVPTPGPGIGIATKAFPTAVGEKQAIAYLNPSTEGVGRLSGDYLSEGNNVLSAMRASWSLINGDESDEDLIQLAIDYDAEVMTIVSETYAMRLAGIHRQETSIKPDFSVLDRAQLSAWYVENVGYDLGADDPVMSLEEFRKICAELDELYRSQDE